MGTGSASIAHVRGECQLRKFGTCGVEHIGGIVLRLCCIEGIIH